MIKIRSRYLVFILSLIYSVNGSAQEIDSLTSVNDLLELKVDSIEQRITVNRWGSDTSYYLHYQVKNISTDTLTYITNSCFYYNHSSLVIGSLDFELNLQGGCYMNSYNVYQIAPNKSFVEAQWITAIKLNKLTNGEWKSSLLVHIVKDDNTTYRVDGRDFGENKQYLNFIGKIKVITTVINNKRKKRKAPNIN